MKTRIEGDYRRFFPLSGISYRCMSTSIKHVSRRNSKRSVGALQFIQLNQETIVLSRNSLKRNGTVKPVVKGCIPEARKRHENENR